MKTLKFISYISCFFIIASCSSDDHQTIQDSDNIDNVNISAYKNTHFSEYENNQFNSYQGVLYGEIINNKYFSFTKETFLDNELQSSTGGQNYFYANESLIKKISEIDEDDVKHFTYSNDGNIIDILWEKNNKNYRLTFVSESVGYFEILDDTGNVYHRIIAHFDGNDNIIEIGAENLQTGTVQNPNYFTYDENNLTGIVLRNGESASINYTNIKNTETFLNDNSFNKKIRRLLCAQALNGTNLQGIVNLNLSTHISTDDANNFQYEVADNGFFKKRIFTTDFSNDNAEGTNTLTLEFIFE